MPEPQALSGIDELRFAAEAYNRNREDFNDRFTAEQLIHIWRHWRKAEWDFFPDQWEERQVRECLELDRTPDWREIDGRVLAQYPEEAQPAATTTPTPDEIIRARSELSAALQELDDPEELGLVAMRLCDVIRLLDRLLQAGS